MTGRAEGPRPDMVHLPTGRDIETSCRSAATSPRFIRKEHISQWKLRSTRNRNPPQSTGEQTSLQANTQPKSDKTYSGTRNPNRRCRDRPTQDREPLLNCHRIGARRSTFTELPPLFLAVIAHPLSRRVSITDLVVNELCDTPMLRTSHRPQLPTYASQDGMLNTIRSGWQWAPRQSSSPG